MVTRTDDCEQLGVEAAAASDAGTAKDGESFDVGAETVDGEDLDGPATGGGDEGAEGGGSGEGGGGEGGDGAAGGNGGDAGGCGGKGGSGGGHIKLLIDPLMLEERSHGGITLICDSGSQAVAPVASWLSLSSTHEVGSRFGCRRLVNSSYETTWSYVPSVSRSSALPLGR